MIQIQSNELKKYFPLLLDICPKVANRLYRAPAGILFDTTKKDETVVMATTDGHRLLHCELPSYTNDVVTIVIPRLVIKQMYSIIKRSKSDEIVHFEVSDTQLIFRYIEYTAYFQLLPNTFPNYPRHLSKVDNEPELTRSIGINPKYLSCLKLWKSDYVEIKIINEETPIFFRSDSYKNMVYMAMPINIHEEY